MTARGLPWRLQTTDLARRKGRAPRSSSPHRLGPPMNKHFYILPLSLLALAACSSSGEYQTNDEQPVISDKTLMVVPADERDDINKARTGHTQALDAVVLAEQEVKRAEQRLAIAKDEVGIADKEMEAAHDRVELARSGVADDRDDRIEEANEGWNGACARKHWARTQVLVEEGRVEQAKCKVALAKRRVALENAKIELAKAKAVKDVDRDDLEPIDIAAFERSVADEEINLKMAEIDVEACEKKMELRQDALEDRAKAIPSSHRKDTERRETEPKG